MTVVPYQRERPWVALQNPAVELANAIASTDFVPRGLRGNPAAITAAILYGDEVGLGPMQSLAKIAVIEGKPSLASEAQRALILAAGHDLWIEESTVTRATVAGRRRDSDQVSRVTWTMDDAKRARIAGRPSWQTYPRQMLLARASAELARLIFADAIGGLSAIEEFDEVALIEPSAALGDGASLDPSPATSSRRRRRPATVPASAPQEDDEPLPELPATEEEDVTFQAPEDVPELLTDGQLRRMMALFRERGFADRENRLAWTRRVIGRQIDSAKELTLGEASQVILALEGLGIREGDQ